MFPPTQIFATFVRKVRKIDMALKKILFVVNPISGTADKKAALDLVPSELPKEEFDVRVEYTRFAGHAYDLGRMAVDTGMDAAVAVGGDGTINELARSLTHTRTALAVIPFGSGNGLARHLRIPVEPLGALKVLRRFHVAPLDYGTINSLPFFCTCGMGFDAFVSDKFSQARTRGPLAYLENILREGLRFKPETYEIKADDDSVTQQAFLITCANASQYGNNALIAPHASMTDGLLDVTIIEPFTVFEAPQIAIRLFDGTLPQSGKVHTFRCSSLHIHRANQGLIHCDGEPLGTGETIDVSVEKSGINVVINDNAPKPVVGGPAATVLYDELSARAADIQNRTVRSLEELRDEIRRRLGRSL